MKIREIFPNVLFAVEYDKDGVDIYHKLFYEEWSNLDGLIEFFEKYKSEISSFLVEELEVDREESEQFAMIVFDEAVNLEAHLRRCAENSQKGDDDGLDTMFEPYGGKFLESKKIPCKCYGENNPSMLRLYAIEITNRCYLIVYGGIKLKKTIQESPVLRDEVDKRFSIVRRLLLNHLIDDETDIKDWKDEEL